MSRQVVVLISMLALFSGSLAHAKKDGVPGGSVGGTSPQHMSQKGQLNTNSPAQGPQEKGAARADQRKSDEGLLHGTTGKTKDKGKAKGQAK